MNCINFNLCNHFLFCLSGIRIRNYTNIIVTYNCNITECNSTLFWNNIIKFNLWEILFKKHYLDISFIEKYIDYCDINNVDWSILSRYQKLSEDFMNKYKWEKF